MQPNNHILLLPSWYPANPKDIRGCFFREQALALVKTGYQVGVVTSELRSLKYWKSIFSLDHGVFFENDLGIQTVRFKTMFWFPKLPQLISQLSMLGGIAAFEKYIRQFGKPDLIHVHSCLYMGRIAQYAKKKYGIEYIVTEHSSGYFRNLYTFKQIELTKSILEDSREVIAVSKKMSEFFKDNIFNQKKWNVIPNIVHPIFLEKPLKNKKHENFKFLNVAFMNENKKQINIVKAFEELLKSGVTDIELYFVGDGNQRKNLEDYIKKNNIKNIIFLGQCNREEIANIMNNSDCFVLSSKFETFGVVLVEALASGLPLVATRCGGPEDIVKDENGILVNVDNINDLFIAMKEVRFNKDRYSKEKLRETCKLLYSEQAVVNQLSKIYQNSSI